jgi:hypothetical protein
MAVILGMLRLTFIDRTIDSVVASHNHFPTQPGIGEEVFMPISVSWHGNAARASRVRALSEASDSMLRW